MQHPFPFALVTLLLISSLAVGIDPTPLVNAGFDLGVPMDLPDDPATPIVYDSTGSVAPGTTENSAHRAALGWSHRVLSGQRPPAGRATWHPDGTLSILVSPQDAGSETAVIAQATGRFETIGLWEGPGSVTLRVTRVEGASVTVRAVYVAPEDPFSLRVSEPAVFTPTGSPSTRTVHFPTGSSEHMSEFMLAFSAEQVAEITLDRVDVIGAAFGPGPSLLS